jgi:hypothetical protein
MRYCTDAGPFRGPLLHGIWPEAIGVLGARDEPMPIGLARCIGRDATAIALWALTIDGDDLPGRWIVIDREFHPAE